MTTDTSPTREAGLTIQEMARQSGLSEHTLRYYERAGLLAPIPRDRSSGHRRYAPETAALVETLSCLRGTGLSLDAMRRFLALRARGPAAAAELRALFAAQVAALAREMERMEARRRYLTGKAAYWEAVEAGDAEGARALAEDNRRLAGALATKKETR